MTLDVSTGNMAQSHSTDRESVGIVPCDEKLASPLSHHEAVTVELASTAISLEVIKQIDELRLDPTEIGRSRQDLIEEVIVGVTRQIAPRSLNTETAHFLLDLKLVTETVGVKLGQLFKGKIGGMHRVA